jgi:hypothetical protein
MAGPVIPERYRAALGDDEPLFALSEAPERLRRLVKGLTEEQLSQAPAPGKWSIKQIVAHLADGEVILGSRYRFAAAHDRPAIAGYDQDLFVEKLGVENTTTDELLADFLLARAVNLSLLQRLPEGALERVALHAERGEESIAKMIAMYAGHDRVHLDQIETIRTGLFPEAGKAPKTAKKPAKKKAKPAKKAAAKSGPKVAKVAKAAKAPKAAKKGAKKPAKKGAKRK